MQKHCDQKAVRDVDKLKKVLTEMWSGVQVRQHHWIAGWSVATSPLCRDHLSGSAYVTAKDKHFKQLLFCIAPWCQHVVKFKAYIIRSTSKSQPNNIRGGKMSVRPSTKSFFDLNEIWYIGRGRWVMHHGMPCSRIQGQGQGHEPLKVWIPSIFKTYLLHHLQWELASDH